MTRDSALMRPADRRLAGAFPMLAGFLAPAGAGFFRVAMVSPTHPTEGCNLSNKQPLVNRLDVRRPDTTAFAALRRSGSCAKPAPARASPTDLADWGKPAHAHDLRDTSRRA